MRHNNFDPSLCLVTNGAVAAKRKRTAEETVLLAVAGGATMVQIREKEMDRGKLADLVARVKPFTLTAGAVNRKRQCGNGSKSQGRRRACRAK
jgi:thiamine monophosphate synthase